MIRAETIQMLMNMDADQLANVLDETGYMGCSFEEVNFQGITECGSFRYNVTYIDEDEIAAGRVYVTYDHKTNKISADF